MATVVHGHWALLVEDYSTSAMDFYTAVQAAVRRREIPGAEIVVIAIKEASVFSAERDYLRVTRERLTFDICAAPFGTGYFFSWWLVKAPPKYALLWSFLFFLSLAVLVIVSVGLSGAALDGCAAIVAQLFVLFLLAPGAIVLAGLGVRTGVIADEETVLGMPIVGWFYERLFSPVTYYTEDTTAMFREAVRAAVNEVLEQLQNEQGLRALSPSELTPQLRNLGK